MNTLPEESDAPELNAQTLTGEDFSLGAGPHVLAFAQPEIHASRLVVGYLRRLKEQLPELSIVIVLAGDNLEARRYATGYLGKLSVVHDGRLEHCERYAVTHVPTTYFLRDGKVALAFTGFSRPAMNRLAESAAEALGAKAKELINASDNKGEYELAERLLGGTT